MNDIAPRTLCRRISFTLCLLGACLAVGFTPGARAAKASALPNIVVIFTDDQGYADVGVFGAKGFRTPNLDRLASEGCKFSNFHVAQPVCSASRAGLLTGCYPNRIGIHGALAPRSKVGISKREMTLAQLVKQRGYPDLVLFEGDKVRIPQVTHEEQNQLTTWYTEHAVKFIESNQDRPFFLYLAHNMPHVPLHVSDKFRGKTERGLYGDVIEEIDWSVGQVMDALKRTGVEGRTWVIFTADNGPWLSYGDHAGSAYPLREGKGTCWEGGTREPCIMRWPGRIPAGTENKQMFMTIDLLPTVAKIIHADLPKHAIDGLDVWPIISGKRGAKNPHDAYWFYYEANQLQSVVSGDGRWKLQLPHSYRTLAGKPGGRDGTPVPYEQRKIESAGLYDLANDVSETTDVAAQHPKMVKQLEAEAEKARAELGDSLTKREGKGVREPGRAAGE